MCTPSLIFAQAFLPTCLSRAGPLFSWVGAVPGWTCCWRQDSGPRCHLAASNIKACFGATSNLGSLLKSTATGPDGWCSSCPLEGCHPLSQPLCPDFLEVRCIVKHTHVYNENICSIAWKTTHPEPQLTSLFYCEELPRKLWVAWAALVFVLCGSFFLPCFRI